ncbi:MAG: hypothetical protein HN406_03610 [Lentisphaerae bacterium]|jgi:hypothetical protein|nr:hypothetical protein [Lentisphaerota bacterium]
MNNLQRRTTGISLRAVLTGTVLVAIISIVSPWAIMTVKGSQLTSNAIPIIAVFLLALLVGLGMPFLKLLGRRFAYARSELITVYVMMLVGSVVVTTGFTGSLLSVATGVAYYATPENDWGALFVPNINQWLVPATPEAIRLFYEGLPQGMPIPWDAWLRPLTVWIAFILVFYWVIFCIGVLLRGQWVDHERLVFPLTRLPLAMLEDADDAESQVNWLFKSKIMWLAFAIPLILHTWNSLNNYHDAFTRIPLNGSVAMLQGLVSIPFRMNFPILGLAYLMPTNVSLSIWFFFLLGRLQMFIFTRLGIQVGTGNVWDSSQPSWLMHEQAGGMVALVLFVLWTARGHLGKLWHQALRRERGDEREALSPAMAYVGLGGGGVFLLFWLTNTGLSLYVAALLLFGALGVFIGLSRIVCEAGIPGCQTPMVPQSFITRGFGPEVLGLKNMTGLGFSTVWIGETAANMMNAVAHSLKLVSTETAVDRRMRWAILLAIVTGLAGSIWFTMSLAYRYGGINLHSWYFVGLPRWPFTYMASVYNAPEPFLPRAGFTLAGGAFMSTLLFLRHRFIWWPLHPIGFPIANTYTIVSYGWFSIFLAWLFKTIILKYGGISIYRALLPFFLGLVLGEFTTACMWVFIDGYYGVEGNMIFNF